MFKKSTFIALTIATSTLLFTQTALAMDIHPRVYLDSNPTNITTIVEKGTTMIPVRALFEYFATEVYWDRETKTVTLMNEAFSIQMQVNNKMAKFYYDYDEEGDAFLSEEDITLSQPPRIINDSLYIPLRNVLELLGAKIEWDEGNKAINIITPVDEDENDEPIDTDNPMYFDDATEILG